MRRRFLFPPQHEVSILTIHMFGKDHFTYMAFCVQFHFQNTMLRIHLEFFPHMKKKKQEIIMNATFKMENLNVLFYMISFVFNI